MRWWPTRRRRLPASHPPEDLLVTEEQLRRSVEDVLAVGDRQLRGGIFVFRGALTMPPARALDVLIERFRPIGYTPFLREDAGVVSVQAWPLAETVLPRRVALNVLLFVVTCLSTLVAGFSFAGSPMFDALRSSTSVARFLVGVPFAATLMAILSVHELGHYFTAHGEPAVFHTGSARLRHVRRDHPHALTGAESQLAVRHRRGRPAGRTGGGISGDSPGLRVVVGRAGAGRRVRCVRRFAAHVGAHLSALRAHSARAHGVHSSDRRRGVGRIPGTPDATQLWPSHRQAPSADKVEAHFWPSQYN